MTVSQHLDTGEAGLGVFRVDVISGTVGVKGREERQGKEKEREQRREEGKRGAVRTSGRPVPRG